jgi:hypothetical protein
MRHCFTVQEAAQRPELSRSGLGGISVTRYLKSCGIRQRR